MSLPIQSGKGEEIGELITKVQDDLQYLRAAAIKGLVDSGAGEGDASVDMEALDMVIARTEQGMQAVAEKVLQSTHDHITTLPAVARREHAKQVSMKADPHIKSARHQRSQNDVLPDLSAGQFCLVKHMSQLVSQPANPLTHRMLANYYDLPTHGPTSLLKSTPGQVLVGTTIDQLTTLPKSNRRDPLLTPPPISQNDACKGLLSLLERGLIPPAAELVLSPPPVQPQSMRLHTPCKQHIVQKIADDMDTQLAGVKLDSATIKPDSSIQIPSAIKSHSPTPSQTLSFKTLELPVPDSKVESLQLPPITPEKKTSGYKVIIQNGCLVDGTNDFILFKQEHHGRWKQILRPLKAIVDLCRNYAIPLCIIDGNSLVRLSMEYELGLKLTKEDLLGVMINRNDVRNILYSAGQRYKGQDGRHAAATKIRATYLMFKERRKYLDKCRRKLAAMILSMAWLTFLRLYNIRGKLKQVRLSHLETHRSQVTEMRKRWTEIQSSRRTIIHMSSRGYSQHVRASIPHFQIEQSLQMGRLCDIKDPDVEVIYVSPTPLGEEMIEYYYKLLAMDSSGRNFKDRVHFVSPENVESFKSHNMALASLLVYSPICLSRIKRLITGRTAYIVSGIVSKDDLALAHKLGVPLLGSEPDVSQLYSTKAGARRLIKDTQVEIPPYEADIFSQEQLLQRLASLIVNNLLISRWIFKLPEQVKGQGFAYFDVIQHLPCYEWVVKEAKRYGSKWKKYWAQEQALKKISSYLPDLLTKHACVVDIALYPRWRDFLEQFLQLGGLIEGAPPSDSVTPIAVDLLIEPTGEVKLLCTLDQICSQGYKVCGGSVPQTSVAHIQLMEAVTEVAEACKARGILGHLSIDFVTFIDPTSMDQRIWCVDLDLGYSNNLALYQLMSYLTGCQLDSTSGALISSKEEPDTYRFAVLAPHLYHSNLSLYYHSVFLQLCKAHYIGYDPNVKLGTIFNLADDEHREYLGMISMQDSLLGAVQTCSSNLSIIHQEISTTSMQGASNFKVIINELDKIIDLINSNTA